MRLLIITKMYIFALEILKEPPNMSESVFRFKQFCIQHDQCAMKVGTDGVLLGAWAPFHSPSHILDIGSGSGLIALMAAQRVPEAEIVGVEIHEPSYFQSLGNVEASPFSDRVRILWQDIREYRPEKFFDHILCNPPFYTQNVLPPDEARSQARNASHLPLEELVACVGHLLDEKKGAFSVVLPYDVMTGFVALCLREALYLSDVCVVRTVERKAPKRVLLNFLRTIPPETHSEILVLQTGNGSRTPQYELLTKDFYL